MRGAHSISTRRAYGVQRVCRVWHCARSSVYARRQATPASCRRRGPVGAAPDDVLVAHICRVLEASPVHGEGYRKAWAKLRVEGIRTSQERVRRLMREHNLQAPHRAGHAHGPAAHDGTITTAAPDVMWGTDMTTTVTVGEGTAYVFVAVDRLRRRTRRRAGPPWPAGDLQHRPGQPVHERRLHRALAGSRHPDLDGRPGPVHGQHLYRAAVAFAQIRGRLSA